jgi:DNA-directed RNA polymerase, omega subunit
MARITVEDCIDKFSSRFELVLVASQRARKLHSGDEPTIERDNDKNTVIALREIADSTISKEEMKENLIQEYQTVSISDEEQENMELQPPIEIDESDEENKETAKENLSTKMEIEQEMNELVSQQDEEIKEQYEINEGEENNTDSSTNEQKLETESLE